MIEREHGAEGSAEVAPGGCTAPLGLAARLRRPSLRLDWAPVLDLAAIALLFALLFTRFVALPGVRVDLPRTDLRMRHAAPRVAVLTIGNEGAYYFDGGIHDGNTIGEALRRRAERAGARPAVLLVKARAEFDLRDFLELCRLAREAGYPEVQIVGDRAEEAAPLIPGGGGDGGLSQ